MITNLGLTKTRTSTHYHPQILPHLTLPSFSLQLNTYFIFNSKPKHSFLSQVKAQLKPNSKLFISSFHLQLKRQTLPMKSWQDEVDMALQHIDKIVEPKQLDG